MAKLIDTEPEYFGEQKVWKDFGKNLPQNWIIYNNRSVNGREYDFCVMAQELGLFIVEVKGWNPNNVLAVVNKNTIFMANQANPEDSPRGQARGYRFALLNKIQVFTKGKVSERQFFLLSLVLMRQEYLL